MKKKITLSKRIFSPLVKLFVFLFIIKTSFFISFAFIGDDLGLDLYKKIDKGIIELNSKMYSHELKGGKVDGTIADNINKILYAKGVYGCAILKNITEEEVHEISYGQKNNINASPNILLLKQKLEGKKCSNSVGELQNIQNIIKGITIDSQESAKTKSDEIYNISKVGLFSDGNIQNSPFDIIKDIKDIDYIIFTQEIDYVGMESMGNSELSNYLDGKLDTFENKLDNKLNSLLSNNSNDSEDNNLFITEEKDSQVIKNKNEGYINTYGDNTKYSCPNLKNESGLSSEELKNLIDSQNNNLTNGNNGPINSNFNGNNSLGENPFSFSTSNGLGNSKGGFNKINDNYFFGGCETFFCINVEFITHKSNLLIGGTTRSIESIMERSNNHLKKFANSSLIQAKMTNNNFELGLRDLNLSTIFSMPIVIVKKTPPILDLDFFNDKVNNDNGSKTSPDPLSRQNLLKARFDSVGINIERENDLSIYENKNDIIKNLINNADMPLSQINKNEKQRKKQIKEMLKLDNHITRIVNSNNQSGDTEGLYKEFIEIERFTSEIQNYVNNLDKVANKMLKIPIHP